MNDQERVREEVGQIFNDVYQAFAAVAEAFLSAFKKAIERALRFWDSLKKFAVDIGNCQSKQKYNRQSVAHLSNIKSFHSPRQMKRMKPQVINRMPIYPIRKII